MNGRRWMAGLVLLAAAGCDATPPSLDFGPGDGPVSLTVSASSYTWDQFIDFHATLTNRSDQAVFAAIGDGFGGPDQELLFIAAGADAMFERETAPGTWQSVAVGIMVEGTRAVSLAPGRSYRLTGTPTAQVDGTYRIRLRYFPDAARAGTPAEVLSSSFTIR